MNEGRKKEKKKKEREKGKRKRETQSITADLLMCNSLVYYETLIVLVMCPFLQSAESWVQTLQEKSQFIYASQLQY